MEAVRLSDEVLEALENTCEKIRFKPGTNIITKGDTLEAMYFLLDGWVEIQFSDDSAGASTLRVGERSIVGEMGYMHRKPAMATARVVSAATAYRLDEETLARFGATHPDAARELAQYLVNTVDKRLQ